MLHLLDLLEAVFDQFSSDSTLSTADDEQNPLLEQAVLLQGFESASLHPGALGCSYVALPLCADLGLDGPCFPLLETPSLPQSPQFVSYDDLLVPSMYLLAAIVIQAHEYLLLDLPLLSVCS